MGLVPPSPEVWSSPLGGVLLYNFVGGHEHMPPGNILVRIREINMDMVKCTHTLISSEFPKQSEDARAWCLWSQNEPNKWPGGGEMDTQIVMWMKNNG